MGTADHQRVTRLGSAGVPITDAFRVCVEEIIDNGPADFDTLNKRVQSALYLKEKRVLSEWGTWDAFTRDILDQISGVDDDAVPTLSEIQGKWSAIEFTRGVAYTAIPGVTFTVWDERARMERDLRARMQMDFTRLKSEIQTVQDRYPGMEEKYLSQVRLAAADFQRMAKEISGSVDPDSDLLMSDRESVPRPDIVRGNDMWRKFTGSTMRFPVKELTIERVKAMPPGTEFTIKGLTLVVGKLLDEIEKPLPQPLGAVKSSTIRQALQGKDTDGTGGLIGDGQITRLTPSTFVRLLGVNGRGAC